jgi:hypothetical protein
MKLKNKALLVHLGISTWSPNKIDRPESAELRKRHSIQQRNAAKVSKRLLESQDLRDVLFIKGQARNEHYRQTLPWKDGDLRIIPTDNFLPYQTKMNTHKAAFEAAVKKFLGNYQQDAQNAASTLGTLYRPEDYPDPRRIAQRFSFSVQFYAISEESDFRVDLGDAEIKALQKDAETLARESVKDAVKDVYGRIAEAVSHLEERLTGTDPNGKDKRFHDTLIENVRALAETLPRLNIAQDPALDAIAAELKARLTKHDPDTLRTDKAARTETAAAAADILKAVETERQKIETLDALGAYR